MESTIVFNPVFLEIVPFLHYYYYFIYTYTAVVLQLLECIDRFLQIKVKAIYVKVIKKIKWNSETRIYFNPFSD